ncbi:MULTISPECIES: hypothetical protein [Streptomyces]|uniref:hypothetical protein n=1 Tax=Streptomyces TaxID=1883 RepID=UPI00345BC634
MTVSATDRNAPDHGAPGPRAPAADRPWNDRCGRALAVLHGAPFVVLKTGHLLHHRYNRTPRERTEVYDARTTTWAKAAPGYYVRLLGGLYLMECTSVLLALLPATVLRRLARTAEAPDTVAGLLLARPRALRQLRTDSAAAPAWPASRRTDGSR